ncbi:MAG TPA: caspase family protein, partial [Anaerolineae bacterium]|nr:caspase family protein [Anaerolineae bacterium]
AVRRAIARFFAEKTRDDLLVLYFSGHGVLDDRGHLYLAVKDTERALPKGTAVEATFITDVMDSSNSRRQVLILDCCHSGAFARGTKGTPGASVHTATAFEGIGSGRVVLTATDSTQYAWEGDQVIGKAENSVFTHYLIEGLKTGEADVDNDGRITLDELYDYVYGQVVHETPKQTPGKWSFKQQGEIVIAKNPRPIVKPVGLPSELQQTIDDPRPWVREGAVRELDRLLHGSHLGLAQAARDALTRLADDDSRRVSTAAAGILATYVDEQRAREAAQAGSARIAPDKAEADRLAAKKAEEERLAREARRVEQARMAAQRAEADRVAREKVERERLAQQTAEAERLAAQKTQAERIAPEMQTGRTVEIDSGAGLTNAIGIPVLLTTIGLGLSWAIAARTLSSEDVIASFVFGVPVPLTVIIVLALRHQGVIVKWNQALVALVGWIIGVVAGGFAVALLISLIVLSGLTTQEANLTSGAVFGAGSGTIGGLITGWVLKRIKPLIQIRVITVGWGLAWTLGWSIWSIVLVTMTDASAEEAVSAMAVTGTIVGAIGGGVMFWHLNQVSGLKSESGLRVAPAVTQTADIFMRRRSTGAEVGLRVQAAGVEPRPQPEWPMLLLIPVGWIIAWAIFPPSVLRGAIGGFITGASLRWTTKALQEKHVFLIAAGWAIAWWIWLIFL